jgi:hypothetical protein
MLISRGNNAQIKVLLDSDELELLRVLLRDLRGVIAEDLEEYPEVAERLFPSASRDDPKVAAAFRKMAYSQLVVTKLEAIDEVLRALDSRNKASGLSITLDQEEANVWLRLVNDLRIFLGCEIGVSDDDLFGPSNSPGSLVYRWLTALESQFLYALTPKLMDYLDSLDLPRLAAE